MFFFFINSLYSTFKIGNSIPFPMGIGWNSQVPSIVSFFKILFFIIYLFIYFYLERQLGIGVDFRLTLKQRVVVDKQMLFHIRLHYANTRVLWCKLGAIFHSQKESFRLVFSFVGIRRFGELSLVYFLNNTKGKESKII